MNTNYLKGKPEGFILIVWEILEDVQNAHPYYNFGWDGFNMIIWE